MGYSSFGRHFPSSPVSSGRVIVPFSLCDWSSHAPDIHVTEWRIGVRGLDMSLFVVRVAYTVQTAISKPPEVVSE